MAIKQKASLLKFSTRWLTVLVVGALFLAACAPAASPSPTPTAVPQAAPTTAAVAPATAPVPVTSSEAALSLGNDPKLGQILVGNNGMTVYAFTKDGPNQSNCTGQCLQNWPPLKTQGSPQLASGVDTSLVGSISLADGTKVVTYNKMPLYFFYKDTKAGDVNGQGVGSVWFTVSPNGKLVGQSAVSGTAPAAESEAAQPAEASINIANDPNLGKILVDGKGMTLYMFAKDTPDKSNCSAGCLKAWPPLLTLGSPKLGDGVDASMIGMATLADGSKIVTYNHMPLYYFIQDKAAGDVKGQGNGSVWFVVSPDGKAVQTAASTSQSSTSAPSSAEAVINVATDPTLGKILVGANGMTLYMFAKDTPDKSNCSAGCLKSWPPLLSQGSPKLGDGVNSALIGSASLADGTKVVTYNHMPLYYFAKDTKAGDTTGQGVGSVWYVVSPDGKPVGQ